MNKDEAIAILRAHEVELRQRGVSHAALFGSVARGEQDEKSDIDIAIEIDRKVNERMGVYEFVGLTQFIADLFPIPADVVNRSSLKHSVKKYAEKDMIDAF